jgi:phage shock protein A
MKAVRQALEAYGGVLQRWQRAADDFKSAAELNPHDANARQNAEVMERQIARLIDQIREMQQAMAAAAQAQQQLKEKMKQMRGKIPDSRMPPARMTRTRTCPRARNRACRKAPARRARK